MAPRLSAGVDFKIAKANFFPKRITTPLNRAEKRALGKMGAFIRRSARSSIRKTKKSSRPGEPPKSHTSDRYATIRNILFFYDETGGRPAVIVGPVKINSSSAIRLGISVPRVLERGGMTASVTRFERYLNGVKTTIRRERRVHVSARPFMNPAMKKETPKLPNMIREEWGKGPLF